MPSERPSEPDHLVVSRLEIGIVPIRNVPMAILPDQTVHSLTAAGNAMDDFDLQIQFAFKADERDHDFGFNLDAFLLDFRGGFENGAGLHLGDLGIDQSQPAAAEAEHGIELVQFFDALADLFDFDAHLLGQQVLRSLVVGQKFM